MVSPFLPSRVPLALLLTRIAIVRSFRTSGLGPLWSTLGVLIIIAAAGLLFGTILRSQLQQFEAYVRGLAAGVVMWSFLSAVVSDSSAAFARWMPILRHSSISFAVIGLSVMLRYLPVLIINIVILLVLQFVLFEELPAWAPLLAATVLLVVNVGWMGLLVMIIGARFRDVRQMVTWGGQIGFLLTPIVWPPYFMGRFEYLLLFNPFFHQLEILTAAAAGGVSPPLHWVVALGMAAAGSATALVVYRWSRGRWRYWI